MRIIEIKAHENGAHTNRRGEFSSIPDGWALIPEGMETPNFPFGEIATKKINGVPTVTKWTPGVKPEKLKADEPITEVEQLRADVDYIAVMTGVEL